MPAQSSGSKNIWLGNRSSLFPKSANNAIQSAKSASRAMQQNHRPSHRRSACSGHGTGCLAGLGGLRCPRLQHVVYFASAGFVQSFFPLGCCQYGFHFCGGHDAVVEDAPWEVLELLGGSSQGFGEAVAVPVRRWPIVGADGRKCGRTRCGPLISSRKWNARIAPRGATTAGWIQLWLVLSTGWAVCVPAFHANARLSVHRQWAASMLHDDLVLTTGNV